MDSLYVRFKFGMSAPEFKKLAKEHPHLYDLVFDGVIEPGHRFQMRPVLDENGVGFTRDDLLLIKDRHKFLDWARNSGLYDEKSLDDLEWLICQEMMKEML